MDREEAIKLIDTHTVCFYNEIDSSTLQALHLAIEALSADAVQEAVPTVVRVTMSDGNQYYLSNESDDCDHCVYKWGTNGGDEIDEMNKEIIKDILKTIPTAYLLEALGVATFEELMESADRPQGEWIDIDNYYRLATCSHCHKVTMFEKWGEDTKPYNFCPNCGADMRGEEE